MAEMWRGEIDRNNGHQKPSAMTYLGADHWLEEDRPEPGTEEKDKASPSLLLHVFLCKIMQEKLQCLLQIFVFTYVKLGDIVSHWRRLII